MSRIGYGDEVLIILDWRRRFLVRVREGAVLHTHKGFIRHDDIAGRSYGEYVESSVGAKFYLAKPRLLDRVLKFRRRTQIIYPKDAAQILLIADVHPGSVVVEAGTGTGALTSVLAMHVQPDGHVYTYEVNQAFYEEARRNIESTGLSKFVTMKLKDITVGIDERDVDAVILDMATPWMVVRHAARSLKPSSMFVSFSPTVNQVIRTVEELERHGFFDIGVMEIIERGYQPRADALRPRSVMIGHTGYIVYARSPAREGDGL